MFNPLHVEYYFRHLEDYSSLLAQRLKRLRQAAGFTQEGVAERAGISYKHYQSIEALRKQDPKLSTIAQLAQVYELEPWELLYSDEPVLSPSFLRKLKVDSGRNQSA